MREPPSSALEVLNPVENAFDVVELFGDVVGDAVHEPHVSGPSELTENGSILFEKSARTCWLQLVNASGVVLEVTELDDEVAERIIDCGSNINHVGSIVAVRMRERSDNPCDVLTEHRGDDCDSGVSTIDIRVEDGHVHVLNDIRSILDNIVEDCCYNGVGIADDVNAEHGHDVGSHANRVEDVGLSSMLGTIVGTVGNHKGLFNT